MRTPADPAITVARSTPALRGAACASLPGEFADALPAGTRLHEFEILSVIGQGGFGIVYLAHDQNLDRRVAIKEYMPSALAARTQAMTVAVRSSRHTETFAAGLRSFVNEARLLAQFDHPSLLKVHRFWEAHGTAYMVMPYYAGITLAKRLTEPAGPPDEAQLRALLGPLLDALGLLHAAHCYHRDIAPDNILLLPGGTPLLLDFGAARRVIGDMTQALTVILKTGYAPVEQYGAMPDLTQGAWTDLYALGSVVEFAITGRTPPQAVTRFLADKREPLAVRMAGRYGDAFLHAIDCTLAVLPKDRPQSVAEMRTLLAVPSAPAPPARTVDADLTVPRVDPVLPPSASPWLTPQAAPVRVPRDGPAPAQAGQNMPSPRWRRRGIALVGAAVLVVVIAALAGGRTWVAASRVGSADSAALAASAASASSATAPLAAPAAVPAFESSAAPTAASPDASSTTVTPAAPASLIGSNYAPSPSPSPLKNVAPDATEPMSPTAAPGAATPANNAAPAQRRTPAHSAHEPAPTPQGSPPIPNKKLPGARCADIIQRVSLGEPLNDADKAILKRECRP